MKVYILLDQSGSMATHWNDTIGGINSYINNLPKGTDVYLASFSSTLSYAKKYNCELNCDYRVLRESKIEDYKQIDSKEVVPHGGTPLLDSMATLLDKAFSDDPRKAYIVVMTDGEENSSVTYSKDVIQEKLARAEDRNWEVIFLGANFENIHNQSQGLGLKSSKSLNINPSNYTAEFRNLSSATVAYASTGTRTHFSDEDKTRASK